MPLACGCALARSPVVCRTSHTLCWPGTVPASESVCPRRDVHRGVPRPADPCRGGVRRLCGAVGWSGWSSWPLPSWPGGRDPAPGVEVVAERVRGDRRGYAGLSSRWCACVGPGPGVGPGVVACAGWWPRRVSSWSVRGSVHRQGGVWSVRRVRESGVTPLGGEGWVPVSGPASGAEEWFPLAYELKRPLR